MLSAPLRQCIVTKMYLPQGTLCSILVLMVLTDQESTNGSVFTRAEA